MKKLALLLSITITSTAFGAQVLESNSFAIVDPSNPKLQFIVNKTIPIVPEKTGDGHVILHATLIDNSTIRVRKLDSGKSYFFHTQKLPRQVCYCNQVGGFLYSELAELVKEQK